MVFTTAGSVRRHMAVHQEERPFMCPYCEKTFKTNVNCKKHMKTHRGNLTAQNPIGKYPPQIIIENPANLHSETVTTESVTCPSELSEVSDANVAQPTIVYKYLSDTPDPSQLGARMYTADETGTITLSENSNQAIKNPNFTMGMSSHQTLTENIPNSISFETSVNISPKSLNSTKLQDEIQTSSQLSNQNFNDSNSLLLHTNINHDLPDANQKSFEQEHLSLSASDTSHIATKHNDLLINYENNESVATEYTQVMTTVSNDGVLALNPSDFGMDMSQLQIPLSQDSSQEINQIVQMDDSKAISNTLENIELNKSKMHIELPAAIQSVINDNDNGNVLNTEKIWRCGNCGEEFTDLPLMKRHLEIHRDQIEADPPSRKERHKCSKCSDVFATAQELKSHENTHEEEPKTFVCDICNAKFSSNSSYVRHQNVHNDKPFKCGHDGCLESYRTVGSLTKHNMVAHGGDPGQFNNAAFRKRTGAHIKLSEEQTKALAETPVELAKTISEKMLLSSAAEKVKADNPVESLLVKEIHANQCDQCEVSFKKPSDLVRHVRTHTGEKPYPCEVCERRFAVKSTLRTHMKVHTGGKTLVCHVCQSLFASRTSLKVHMRLHTGSLPYKCNICEQRFRTPAHRKTHVNNHCRSTEESKPTTDDMIPLTISAESLTAALDAVSSSGAPLIGATVQLQLHGHGFESAMTQLQIDEELLSQLRKGENINISISQMQLNNGKKELKEHELESVPDLNLNGDQTGITNQQLDNKTPDTPISSECEPTKQSVDPNESNENLASDILTQQNIPSLLPETPLMLSSEAQHLILPLNRDDSTMLRSSVHDPSMVSTVEFLTSVSEDQETMSTITSNQTTVSHAKPPSTMPGQSLLLQANLNATLRKPQPGLSDRVILLPGGSHGDMLSGIGSSASLLSAEREVMVGNMDNEVSGELNYSVSTDENGRILDIRPGGETHDGHEDKVINLSVPQFENDIAENSSGTLQLPLLDQMDISQVYICPWCDRVFRTEKDRIEHLLSGHGVEVKEDVITDAGVEEQGSSIKEKICSVCDKKFMKPSQLVRHMRVHTGERPFACLMCRKSFNQKNALQIHMKKHTGERPYVCPFCQYAFTQKGNLKTHIQRSHAEIAQQIVQKSLQGQSGLLPEKTNITVATGQGGTISIDLADLLGPVLK